MGRFQKELEDRPYVILNAAMSVDGKIATKMKDSKLSSKEDLIRVHVLRACVDAILIGINTVLIDNPSLTVRYSEGKNPIRIVIDSQARTPINSRIISNEAKTIIAISSYAPLENIKNLKNAGVEIILCGSKMQVDVQLLLKELKKIGVKKILVEGGGNINWSFIKNDLFDELNITLCPYIIGGRDAITLVEGEGFERINEGCRLKLWGMYRLNDEVIISYKPLRRDS